jgi:hypothetical protein
MGDDDIRIPGWIRWIAGVVVSAMMMGIGLAAYAFTTFQTKVDAVDDRQLIVEWLERIENKIDALPKK